MTNGLIDFVLVSVALLAIGIYGIAVKRNAIRMLFGIEMIVNSANLNLVAFSRYIPNSQGQTFALFSIAIAAAEVAVGLALVIANVLFLGACLAFVAGAFCAWQAWMMWSRISGTYQVDSVSRAEVVALNQFVADTRLRVIHEINSDAVATALATGDEAGEAAAVTVLKKGIPDLVAADFYRADLSDVLGTDFAKFGYAKAAMLVQAHQSQMGAPLQSHLVAAKQRVLAFALPVTHDKQT